MYFNRIGFGLLFLVLTLGIKNVDSACQAIPVALSSNTTLCTSTNGKYICTINSIAIISLQAIVGQEACFDFVSPDGKSPAQSVFIRVLASDEIRNLNYRQYTDDPKITQKGACGCPGGSLSISDSGCPGTDHVGGDAVAYSYGTHSSKSCVLTHSPFNKVGDWCLKTALTGNKRYVVDRWSEAATLTALFSLSFKDNTNTSNSTYSYAFPYYGQPIEHYNSTIPFKVEVISNTINEQVRPKFTVYDSTPGNNHDFYLFSEEVNSQDEYNPKKIGWYKTDQSIFKRVSPLLGKQITGYVLDCKSDKIGYSLPWFNIADFLHKSASNLASTLIPRAYIDDGFFTHIKPNKEMNHDFDPYTYIKDGWIIITVDNQPGFYGVDEHDFLTPFPSTDGFNSYGPLRIYKGGLIPANSYATNNSTLTKSPVINIAVYANGNISSVATSYSLFTLFYNQEPVFCLSVSNVPNCYDFTFIAPKWPDNHLYRHIYNASGFFIDPVDIRLTKSASPVLIDPTTTGSYELGVTFLNLVIEFKNNDVVPIIDSIKATDRILSVKAHSSLNAGECRIGSTPAGILLNQPIELTATVTEYRYRFEAEKYSGKMDITILCFKDKATKSITVSYDATKDVLDPIGGESPPSDDSGDHWSDGVGDWLSNAWDSFTGLFGGVKWLAIVIYVICAVIAIAIIIAILSCLPGKTGPKIIAFFMWFFFGFFGIIWAAIMFIPRRISHTYKEAKTEAVYKKTGDKSISSRNVKNEPLANNNSPGSPGIKQRSAFTIGDS